MCFVVNGVVVAVVCCVCVCVVVCVSFVRVCALLLFAWLRLFVCGLCVICVVASVCVWVVCDLCECV